ncbi:hypothetical protein Tco_1213346 [Tanacetum coccineum]
MLPEIDYAHDDSNFYGCAGLRLEFEPTKLPDYKVVRAGRNSCEIVIQIYSSESDNWTLCRERFTYFFFVYFDSAMVTDIHKRTKSSQNGQNRARNGKSVKKLKVKVKSQSREVKVKDEAETKEMNEDKEWMAMIDGLGEQAKWMALMSL